jgi:CelD/BcsL family acetyltransferase involved in cellulose biosynthesis
MTLFGSAIESNKPGTAVRPRRPADVVAFPSAAETAILRSFEELEALAPEWVALGGKSGGATLFQSAAWARAIYDFEQQRANSRFDPLIVTLRHRGKLQAVLPLERVRTSFRTVLMPLGQNFQQYADMMVLPGGPDPVAALAAMLDEAVASGPCDLVLFLKVREDSALFAAMPRNRVATGTDEAAPYVSLSDHADFNAYHQTIKSKTRKNMRNARNRLERDGELAHTVAATREDFLGVISRTLAGRATRLRDQGLTSRAFQDSSFSDFCVSMADRRPGRPELLAMSLTHNGQPIAEQWGFVHEGRYYAYVASRDFSVAEESPGKLHLKDVIETCFAHKLDTVDLLVPSMPYKLTWATGVTRVHDYALPMSLKGRAAVHVYDRTLRPMLKRAVLRMPRGLRTTLMKLAGRA